MTNGIKILILLELSNHMHYRVCFCQTKCCANINAASKFITTTMTTTSQHELSERRKQQQQQLWVDHMLPFTVRPPSAQITWPLM